MGDGCFIMLLFWDVARLYYYNDSRGGVIMTYNDCLHFVVCDRCPNCKPDECEFFENKADVVEVKHGEWIRHKENCLYNKCSICEKEHCREDNYCPNCGAKMDGGTK